MPAFTDLAGIPMTAHVGLLRGWLRGRLGFNGVIVSDYNAIAELMRHGVAADLTEAATLALKAGVDIDMMANAYRSGCQWHWSAVWSTSPRSTRRCVACSLSSSDWACSTSRIGAAPCRRAPRRSLGAASWRVRSARAPSSCSRTTTLRYRCRIGARLAIIGPLADAASEMGGPWSLAGDPKAHVSVLAGLRAALRETEIVHVTGVAIQGDDTSGIQRSLDALAAADAIILCLGEAANMSGEAASRASLDLPGQQRALAQAVMERTRALGKPVIAVLFSGRPLAVPWLIERADAVLAAWFLGCEAGHCIADVLTGAVSPSGRTPMTWPRAVGQIPIFFGQRSGGRPADPNNPYTSRYLDLPTEPLFAFGHGLTYGRFSHSNLRVTPHEVSESDSIEIRIDVANQGARAAEETVFLFTHDRLASVSRPLLELKGFGKIALGPGERGTVTQYLPASELRFLGPDLQPVFEAGDVEILVGPCADRSQLLLQVIRLRGSPGGAVAASAPRR